MSTKSARVVYYRVVKGRVLRKLCALETDVIHFYRSEISKFLTVQLTRARHKFSTNYGQVAG